MALVGKSLQRAEVLFGNELECSEHDTTRSATSLPHSGTVVFCFPLVLFDPGVGASVVEDRTFERTDSDYREPCIQSGASRPHSTTPGALTRLGVTETPAHPHPPTPARGGSRQTRLILVSIDFSIDSLGRCLFTFLFYFLSSLPLPSIALPNYCGLSLTSAQKPGSRP